MEIRHGAVDDEHGFESLAKEYLALIAIAQPSESFVGVEFFGGSRIRDEISRDFIDPRHPLQLSFPVALDKIR
jgi:hypothetical protein